MKILHVIDNIQGGGKERRMIQLCQGLLKEEINVEILVIENKIDYLSDLDSGIKIHSLIGNPKNYLSISFQLYKRIRGINPDIVQIWSSLVSSTIISTISYILRKKIIGSYITVARPFNFFHKHYIIKHLNFFLANLIVANSKAGLEAFRVPSGKAKIIYNGINESRLKVIKPKDDLRAQFNITEKHMVIKVARFDKAKDYDTFLKAAAVICQHRQDIAFVCLGQGIMLDPYREKYKNHGAIYFLGFQEDSLSFINASDLMVLCTNTNLHIEGVSNSLIESMYLGKPVIATEGGGTDEIVFNGKNGWLVDSANVSELISKIVLTIDDEYNYINLSRSAKEFAQANFKLDDKVKEYISIYNDLFTSK